eukprot:CAMPEP_0174983702 /NCGR_PEP_ID=MMETSP0004_2-20121128/17299_1 /TAXON_ID=420556 /ORGANISM="Ochromonas sp., Strain CCMP1393" /LENGTH=957 /DNA_ID=CAMNT_0016236001 /DNA_START=35 /DNA_END=2905 /DNA_ORIENTATION=+
MAPFKQSQGVHEKLPRHLWRLRALLAASLICIATAISALTYYTLSENEEALALSNFDSLSDEAFRNMRSIIDRFTSGIEVMRINYAEAFPDQSDWPNVYLPTYSAIAPIVADFASLDTISFSPIVKADELSAYESYIFDKWDSDPNVPVTAGYHSPTERGVYSGLTDSSGATIWNSSFGIYTPITQFHSRAYSPVYGFDAHSEEATGRIYDSVIECVNARNYTTASTDCVQIVDAIIFQSNPNSAEGALISTGILTPIMLQENSSQLVGFVNGLFDWQFLLTESVAESVDGVVAVITTDTVSATYHISQGNQVDFVAIGDAHEPSCSRHDRTETFKLGASTSGLTVTFYACDAYFEDNSTEIPTIASIVVAGTFLIVIAVFLTYDSMVRYGFLYEQALLETKRNFVRYTSHEIRTPLNTVVLGLKVFGLEVDTLLKDAQVVGNIPPTGIDFLRNVIKNWRDLTNDILVNTESAIDILNDLLSYDKVEAGTLRLEFASVSIPDLVQSTVSGFKMQALQKELNVKCNTNMGGADLPASTKLYSIGDTARLSQVMRNFLSNALKFTSPKGNINVEVEWLPEEELGSARLVEVPEDFEALLENPRAGVVRVSVTDSGAGLSAEQLAQVGGDGVQFNASKLQGGGGSGVGLFLTKSIIEQHGGMMRVSSQGLDQGSTFSFDLPLFAAKEEESNLEGIVKSSSQQQLLQNDDTTETAEQLTTRPTCIGGSETANHDCEAVNPRKLATTRNNEPKHLLIVDDASSNRRLLMRILTIKGYTCEDADNGQKAIDKYKEILARKGKVDAILMDFQMPVMDGPTATKHLRAMGCRCFIVGVTGNVMQDDIDHYKTHGADAVLGKPLNTDAFESLLRSFETAARRGLLPASKYACQSSSSIASASNRNSPKVGTRPQQVAPSESLNLSSSNESPRYDHMRSIKPSGREDGGTCGRGEEDVGEEEEEGGG